MGGVPDPTPLWTPTDERRRGSRMQAFLDSGGFGGYDEAWRWSVSPDGRGAFWDKVARDLGVVWARPPDATVEPDPASVPGARWFPGALLNYAENALRPRGDGGKPAVISVSQTRPAQELGRDDLEKLVRRVREGLLRAGVTKGDRVAGYLPNIPETLAAMLASASIGAVWSCCAPETGVAGVLDRFSQIGPKVLICADGYRFGDRVVDRVEQATAIRDGLPSLETSVWLPYLEPAGEPPARWMAWQDFTAADTPAGPLDFEPVAFDHPLYVLFSSGTTGKPKPIVHCHGGITLEHAKALALHFDLGEGDRFFWFTTTGWMMWNFCVSGLLAGAAVVMFDGDPASPSMETLWQVMSETRTTCGGVGSGFLVACQKAGIHPGEKFDLRRLRTLGATGSPLPGSAARWVYDEVGDDVLVASFSGGTDVCTGFVGASPVHPVWPGEISCRCLGAAVEVFDDDGKPVVGEEGELVLTAPLPSMPVGFWGDATGDRYRAAYFERFPGVWAHGDRATLTERGTVIITGRSDGTLNRGGVRIGTAELYEVVESHPGVADSLVVHLDDAAGGPGEIWLLVVPATEAPAGQLEDELKAALRRDLSPRHVPDRVVRIQAVPRTLSGKKLEVPVKRILSGAAPDDTLTVASLANPESLDPILTLAEERRRESRAGH